MAANSSPDRDAAIDMLDAWDGHFVAGGPAAWRMGTLRADAWVLQDAWVDEVLRITFEDEFRAAGMSWEDEAEVVLFNVLLHALAGQTLYDWFQDAAGTGDKPVGAEAIIVRALDNVIEHLGLGPYNAPRGVITFGHSLLGELDPAFNAIHAIPFSERSTYAHVVEYGPRRPDAHREHVPARTVGQTSSSTVTCRPDLRSAQQLLAGADLRPLRAADLPAVRLSVDSRIALTPRSPERGVFLVHLSVPSRPRER